MKKRIFRWAWRLLDTRTRTAIWEALDDYSRVQHTSTQWKRMKQSDARELKDYLIKIKK